MSGTKASAAQRTQGSQRLRQHGKGRVRAASPPAPCRSSSPASPGPASGHGAGQARARKDGEGGRPQSGRGFASPGHPRSGLPNGRSGSTNLLLGRFPRFSVTAQPDLCSSAHPRALGRGGDGDTDGGSGEVKVRGLLFLQRTIFPQEFPQPLFSYGPRCELLPLPFSPSLPPKAGSCVPCCPSLHHTPESQGGAVTPLLTPSP